jgi:tRNA modification GTPase
LTVVRNKSDLAGLSAAITAGEPTVITMSAKTGSGLALLRAHLKESVGFSATGEGNFLARRRHVDALQQAREYLCNGQRQLLGAGAGELLAEDLRHSQRVLGEITGAVSADELLGKIFSSFCIGK